MLPPGMTSPQQENAQPSPESRQETSPPPSSVAAPIRLTPPSASAPQQRPAASTAPAPTYQNKSRIEIDGLTRVDSESIGVLSEQNGGLGMDMWQGVTRTDALRLISTLPVEPAYPALRSVQTRFLLSRAQAPVAVAEEPASLLAKRAQILMQMGQADDAQMLLRAAPLQDRPQGLDQVDATMQFLVYDNARACGLAQNNRANAGEDFWQRLLIYCDALDGKADQVNFGLSLLRETSGDDAAMTLLADSILTDKPVELETITAPKPIHFALSRAAKSQLPADIAKSDDPLILYAASKAPNLLLGAKIEAAERAVIEGVLDPAELRRLYSEVPFEDADISNALTRADEVGGSGARALLYQAAAKVNIPVARGEIITSAILAGREDDRYRATILAFKPLIDRLPPSPEMVWFALTGVRAYLTLGDVPGVERWIALLRASAQVSEETKRALIRVRPLVYLLGVGDRTATLDEILAEWRGVGAGDPELQPAGALINGMLLALGETLPKDAWDGLEAARPSVETLPPPALWFRFRDAVRAFAAASNRAAAPRRASAATAQSSDWSARPLAPGGDAPGLAEPLALTLQAMAGQPGATALYEGVAALRALGLEDAARRLAVEAVLRAGV